MNTVQKLKQTIVRREEDCRFNQEYLRSLQSLKRPTKAQKSQAKAIKAFLASEAVKIFQMKKELQEWDRIRVLELMLVRMTEKYETERRDDEMLKNRVYRDSEDEVLEDRHFGFGRVETQIGPRRNQSVYHRNDSDGDIEASEKRQRDLKEQYGLFEKRQQAYFSDRDRLEEEIRGIKLAIHYDRLKGIRGQEPADRA